MNRTCQECGRASHYEPGCKHGFAYRVPLSTAPKLSDVLDSEPLGPLPKPLTRASSLKAKRIPPRAPEPPREPR